MYDCVLCVNNALSSPGLQLPIAFCRWLHLVIARALLCIQKAFHKHRGYRTRIFNAYLILSYLILSYLILSYLILSYLIWVMWP